MTEATENDKGMKGRVGGQKEREQPSRGWLQEEQRALILTSSACHCRCKAAAGICRTDCAVKNAIN